MRRQERVRLQVPAADVPTAVALLRERRRGSFRAQGLWIRVHRDGGVRMAMGSPSPYRMMPHLRGRLRPQGRDVVLEAVVRESWSEALLPVMFAVLAGVLGAIAVVMLCAGQFDNPGLYVCGAGAVALGVLARMLGRQRPGSFDDGARRLVGAACSHLGLRSWSRSGR